MRNQGRTSHHTGTDGPAATAGAARWQAPWPDQTPAGGRHGRLPPPAAHFEIEQAITPLAAQVAQLDEIPGIGTTAAQDDPGLAGQVNVAGTRQLAEAARGLQSSA